MIVGKMHDSPYNARYEKLSRPVREMKFKVQQTINIPSGHLRPFAGFEVIVHEVIRCKEIIKILRNAFLGVRPYAQHVCITPPVMSSQPCLAKIGPDIRQEDIPFLICCNRSCRRDAQ